jgi:AraC-like DNA-binding protein
MNSNKSAFCQVLDNLRVSGALVLTKSYQPPWAIEVPEAAELCSMLGLRENITVVPFHLVRRGHFELIPQEGRPFIISEGEIIICTNGLGHRMQQGRSSQPLSFTDLVKQGRINTQEVMNSGETEIICGAFLMQDTKHNPLIGALPPIMQIGTLGEGSSSAIRHLFKLLVGELKGSRNGQSYMLERQLEMLYAEAIRVYSSNHPDELGGWLKAIHEPRMATVLNYIHNNVAGDLSVKKLAALVHMSGSRFAACFREIIGQPPMTYVTKWRMHRASRLLRESNVAISELAYVCGYASLEAFNRAFKQYFSTSPSKWRKQRLSN